MKVRRKKVICYITAFVMAVTVFGCTSISFAEPTGSEDDGVATDEMLEGTEDTSDSGQTDDDLTGGDDQNVSNDNGTKGNDVVQLTAPTNAKAVGGYTKITLSWGAVAPKNDGTVAYNIYDASDSLIETATGATYTVSNLSERAAQYTYKISAVEKDEEGNVIEGTESDKTSVTGQTYFSDKALSGLVSDPGYKAVLLEWNAVEGADGYEIYRRQGMERGNIDNYCRDSDGHLLKTYKSSKSKGYTIKSPGAYKKVKDLTGSELTKATANGKVNYRNGGLKDLDHTMVYYYQYIVVPYQKDNGKTYYNQDAYDSKGILKWSTSSSEYKNYGANASKDPNVVKNNVVLPLYILYRVKASKPYYKTHKMSDGKKMGRLPKGHYYIGFDKKDGRDRFYWKKSGTSRTEWWFAQKNAKVVQGFYLNNGNRNNLNRKDWATGYSKKTVLDYVNHAGLSSKTSYLIWVSKYAQHTYIFTGSKGNWKLVNGGKNGITTTSTGYWSNLCASGKVVFNSRNINGPIYGKQYVVKRKHHWYYYVSKLHSTVRIHSVLYKRGAKFNADVSKGKYHDKTLGAPKSNGCIRHKPAAAKWIYTHCGKGTRTLVY